MNFCQVRSAPKSIYEKPAQQSVASGFFQGFLFQLSFDLALLLSTIQFFHLA